MNDFYDAIKWTTIVMVMLAVVISGAFLIAKKFNPKWEELRRATYEESRAHVVGTIEHLQRLKLQFVKASDKNEQEAIARLYLTEASSIHPRHLPEDLRRFGENLMNIYENPRPGDPLFDTIADSSRAAVRVD